MTITALPTRTVGSLGPDKVNRRAVSDPYKQLDADEYNLTADWIVHLANTVGVESGPAWDSLQGLHSGDTFELYENFLEPIVSITRWASAIGAPQNLIGNAGGGIVFDLDAQNDYSLQDFFFVRAQTPYVRFRGYTTGADPDYVWIYFVDTTGNEGWGVEWKDTGTKIRGWTMTGGVKTYTDVSTWTTGLEIPLEFYVSANTLYVSANGAAAVDCGTVPTGNMTFSIFSGGAGTVAEHFVMRNLLIRADWS